MPPSSGPGPTWRNTWPGCATLTATFPYSTTLPCAAPIPSLSSWGWGERIGVSVDTSQRLGGRHFAETGTAIWHGDPWSLFLDLGPVGPDAQPGHAHADTLTLETSFAGQRLFVDPGILAYDDDSRRAYDRGTEAHNTVCIDGTDSSEMWKIFRVGRRARPRDVAVEIKDHAMRAAGSHDGYDHLLGEPTSPPGRHRQRWRSL